MAGSHCTKVNAGDVAVEMSGHQDGAHTSAVLCMDHAGSWCDGGCWLQCLLWCEVPRSSSTGPAVAEGLSV